MSEPAMVADDGPRDDGPGDGPSPDVGSAADRRTLRERWAVDRGWWLGLAGIALLLGGSGWYQLWVGAPYRYVDEQAHAGYVLAIQSGHLPTIDTPIDAAHGGTALRERLAREPERRRDVWVANNPPLPYVVAAAPAALTRALGLPGGPLLGLRAVNLLGAVAACVYLARLAATLAGDDRRVGLVAGALFAAAPHLGFIMGIGFTDGPALLCSMAMLDALATLCRRGPTNRQVVVLSAWCALGAGVRPMTAALAAGVMAMAGAVIVLRRVRGLDAAPGILRSALVLGLPTAAISGWWYARNLHLYGDATGSEYLLDKFVRTPRQSPIHILEADSVWRENLRTLVFRRLENQLPGDFLGWWTWLRWGIVVAIAATAILVVKDQVLDRGTGVAPRTPALSWLAMVGSVIVVVALIAQHWSGGGSTHARYAFPAYAVLCTAVALVAVRLGTRWAGLALVAGQLAIQARQVPIATDWVNDHPATPFSIELVDAIGPPWLRLAGGLVVVGGALALVVALAWLPKPSDERA